MPWTGSVKSSDSTILSCLSPRSPCCGPNAAVSLTPAAASASRLWVRSRVTDAGWASKATRWPSSGLRNSGSASSRSIPNKVMLDCLRKLRGEAIGMVEIGQFRRVGKRPVGLGAVLLFQHRRQSELPFLGGVDGDRRADGPPGEIVLHPDVGRRADLGPRHVFPAPREIIGRPIARRREIPLAIGLRAERPKKDLEAGRQP